MELKHHYTRKEGITEITKAGGSSLKHLGFSIIDLYGTTRSLEFETGPNECALIILSGTCSIAFDQVLWNNVGQRKSVFEGKAWAAYIPRNKRVKVSSSWKTKIAMVTSPVDVDTDSKLIKPDEVKTVVLGKPTWKRDTHFIVDDRCPSKSLCIGEAFVHPGNWAGFPPHKHDVDDMPDEAVLEEFYYFLFQPEQGFALQRVYTDDRTLDQAYVVEQDDMVEFPNGYHPIVNAPGYSCYFLWAMAGDHKGFYRRSDPDHAWLSAVETIMNKAES